MHKRARARMQKQREDVEKVEMANYGCRDLQRRQRDRKRGGSGGEREERVFEAKAKR